MPLESVANARHGHWRVRARMVLRHRQTARMMCRVPASPFAQAFAGGHPLRITLTRIGRKLDSDNLPAAFKHVRDGVADALGLKNDEHARLEWRYAQRYEPKMRIEVLFEVAL